MIHIINLKIFLPQSWINMPLKKENGLRVIINHINKELRKAIKKDQDLKKWLTKLKSRLILKFLKYSVIMLLTWIRFISIDYFHSCNSAGSKLFWINCKVYFCNKYNKVDTDIALNENGNLILKTKKLLRLLMFALAQLLITLICIIGKTKLLLHQALLIKLMTLSIIMKNM